jgi:hypothetical protein
VSGPGLLMISFGNAHLADVVERRELGVAGRSCAVSPSSSTTDSVTELELVVDPNPPLTREHREQTNERKGEHDAVRR